MAPGKSVASPGAHPNASQISNWGGAAKAPRPCPASSSAPVQEGDHQWLPHSCRGSGQQTRGSSAPRML